MARTVTLAELRDMVRRRADIVNDPFHPDSEIDDYINEGIAELDGKKASARQRRRVLCQLGSSHHRLRHEQHRFACDLFQDSWRSMRQYTSQRKIKLIRMDFQKFLGLDNNVVSGWNDWSDVIT